MTSMVRVLLIGFEPSAVPGVDPEAVTPAFEQARRRAREESVELVECLIALDDSADAQLEAALTNGQWDCIVIGGGIRKPDAVVELLEYVVNTAIRRAPSATLAFNTSPADTVESALRALGHATQA